MVAHLSFWFEQLGGPPETGSPLTESVDADVCIVGAGYTGLWTAYALLGADPALRVVLVDASYPGAGASGRNGGWLSALMPGDRTRLAHGPAGRDGVVAIQHHLIEAVDAIHQVCLEEEIDADLVKGGTIAVATNRAQMARLQDAVDDDHRWGLTDKDICLRDGSPGVDVYGAVGSSFSPHCARIQPAKLLTGLVSAVTRRGAVVYRDSPVVDLSAGTVRTPHGAVRAPWIVRATEGYTASLPGLRRAILPMNSSMIVTSPLPASAWQQIGWAGCETLRDAAHAYVYLQRTADGRIAIGGRGRPYRFGSGLANVGTTPASTVTSLWDALCRLFPAVASAGAGVDAAWSGVLGVARDWCPSVGTAPSGLGGVAWAGGYVGDGVATSYLCGSTVADLVLGRSTERTSLPWVGHLSRRWEPEPLRWLGVRAVYGLYRAADRAEARNPERTGSSPWAGLAGALAGRH